MRPKSEEQSCSRTTEGTSTSQTADNREIGGSRQYQGNIVYTPSNQNYNELCNKIMVPIHSNLCSNETEDSCAKFTIWNNPTCSSKSYQCLPERYNNLNEKLEKYGNCDPIYMRKYLECGLRNMNYDFCDDRIYETDQCFHENELHSKRCLYKRKNPMEMGSCDENVKRCLHTCRYKKFIDNMCEPQIQSCMECSNDIRYRCRFGNLHVYNKYAAKKWLHCDVMEKMCSMDKMIKYSPLPNCDAISEFYFQSRIAKVRSDCKEREMSIVPTVCGKYLTKSYHDSYKTRPKKSSKNDQFMIVESNEINYDADYERLNLLALSNKEKQKPKSKIKDKVNKQDKAKPTKTRPGSLKKSDNKKVQHKITKKKVNEEFVFKNSEKVDKERISTKNMKTESVTPIIYTNENLTTDFGKDSVVVNSGENFEQLPELNEVSVNIKDALDEEMADINIINEVESKISEKANNMGETDAVLINDKRNDEFENVQFEVEKRIKTDENIDADDMKMPSINIAEQNKDLINLNRDLLRNESLKEEVLDKPTNEEENISLLPASNKIDQISETSVMVDEHTGEISTLDKTGEFKKSIPKSSIELNPLICNTEDYNRISETGEVYMLTEETSAKDNVDVLDKPETKSLSIKNELQPIFLNVSQIEKSSEVSAVQLNIIEKEENKSIVRNLTDEEAILNKINAINTEEVIRYSKNGPTSDVKDTENKYQISEDIVRPYNSKNKEMSEDMENLSAVFIKSMPTDDKDGKEPGLKSNLSASKASELHQNVEFESSRNVSEASELAPVIKKESFSDNINAGKNIGSSRNVSEASEMHRNLDKDQITGNMEDEKDYKTSRNVSEANELNEILREEKSNEITKRSEVQVVETTKSTKSLVSSKEYQKEETMHTSKSVVTSVEVQVEGIMQRTLSRTASKEILMEETMERSRSVIDDIEKEETMKTSKSVITSKEVQISETMQISKPLLSGKEDEIEGTIKSTKSIIPTKEEQREETMQTSKSLVTSVEVQIEGIMQRTLSRTTSKEIIMEETMERSRSVIDDIEKEETLKTSKSVITSKEVQIAETIQSSKSLLPSTEDQIEGIIKSTKSVIPIDEDEIDKIMKSTKSRISSNASEIEEMMKSTKSLLPSNLDQVEGTMKSMKSLITSKEEQREETMQTSKSVVTNQEMQIEGMMQRTLSRTTSKEIIIEETTERSKSVTDDYEVEETKKTTKSITTSKEVQIAETLKSNKSLLSGYEDQIDGTIKGTNSLLASNAGEMEGIMKTSKSRTISKEVQFEETMKSTKSILPSNAVQIEETMKSSKSLVTSHEIEEEDLMKSTKSKITSSVVEIEETMKTSKSVVTNQEVFLEETTKRTLSRTSSTEIEIEEMIKSTKSLLLSKVETNLENIEQKDKDTNLLDKKGKTRGISKTMQLTEKNGIKLENIDQSTYPEPIIKINSKEFDLGNEKKNVNEIKSDVLKAEELPEISLLSDKYKKEELTKDKKKEFSEFIEETEDHYPFSKKVSFISRSKILSAAKASHTKADKTCDRFQRMGRLKQGGCSQIRKPDLHGFPGQLTIKSMNLIKELGSRKTCLQKPSSRSLSTCEKSCSAKRPMYINSVPRVVCKVPCQSTTKDFVTNYCCKQEPLRYVTSCNMMTMTIPKVKPTLCQPCQNKRTKTTCNISGMYDMKCLLNRMECRRKASNPCSKFK